MQRGCFKIVCHWKSVRFYVFSFRVRKSFSWSGRLRQIWGCLKIGCHLQHRVRPFLETRLEYYLYVTFFFFFFPFLCSSLTLCFYSPFLYKSFLTNKKFFCFGIFSNFWCMFLENEVIHLVWFCVQHPCSVCCFHPWRIISSSWSWWCFLKQKHKFQRKTHMLCRWTTVGDWWSKKDRLFSSPLDGSMQSSHPSTLWSLAETSCATTTSRCSWSKCGPMFGWWWQGGGSG